MSEIKDGGPAFAGYRTEEFMGLDGLQIIKVHYAGMSLRDWFAGQALALAHADYIKGVPEYDLKKMFGGRGGLTREEIVAALAHRYATAMLAAREAA